MALDKDGLADACYRAFEDSDGTWSRVADAALAEISRQWQAGGIQIEFDPKLRETQPMIKKPVTVHRNAHGGGWETRDALGKIIGSHNLPEIAEAVAAVLNADTTPEREPDLLDRMVFNLWIEGWPPESDSFSAEGRRVAMREVLKIVLTHIAKELKENQGVRFTAILENIAKTYRIDFP